MIVFYGKETGFYTDLLFSNDVFKIFIALIKTENLHSEKVTQSDIIF